MLRIQVEFEVKDLVYIKTDPDQEQYFVIGYQIVGEAHEVKYILSERQFPFYGFELTTEKSIF